MSNAEIAYIELLGITLSGSKRPDQGLYWTDLKGWWGLPELRGTPDSIPGDHGRFTRVARYRDSRVMQLTGHILTTSNRELVAVRDRLEAALADGFGEMKVFTNTAGAWNRLVEVVGLEVEPDHGKEWVKFIVDLIAPDPRRYADTTQVGPVGNATSRGGLILPQEFPWNFGARSEEERLVIANYGTIDLYPRVKVSGGFGSVSVRDLATGRVLAVTRPVDEGDYVEFNCGTRKAFVNGEDITRWLTSREWFTVHAGASHELRFETTNTTGEPKLSASYEIGAW